MDFEDILAVLKVLLIFVFFYLSFSYLRGVLAIQEDVIFNNNIVDNDDYSLLYKVEKNDILDSLKSDSNSLLFKKNNLESFGFGKNLLIFINILFDILVVLITIYYIYYFFIKK